MSEQINETYFAWLNKRIDKYEPPSREEVWNAATAEANKRINALEGTVTRLRARLIAEKELLYDQIKIDMKTSRENEQLKANNNDLREALEKTNSEVTGDAFGRWDTTERTTIKRHIIANICGKALSENPAESLQAHDAELVAKVTTILSGIDKTESESTEGWWETSTGAKFGAYKLQLINSLKD